MEDSKSSTNNGNHDRLCDALDEFSFSDCPDNAETDQSISDLSSISQLEADADALAKPKPSPEIITPNGLRNRRSWSDHNPNCASGDDSNSSSFSSSRTFDAATPVGGKLKFSGNLKENDKGNENSACEESKDNSTINTENDERGDESAATDSVSIATGEPSSNIMSVLACWVIKAIRFQLSFLLSFITFPIRFLYGLYMFLIDPFQVVRLGRRYLMGILWKIVWKNCVLYAYKWLKEYKHIWKLGVRFGWGFLWAIYICFIMVSLLVSSFLVSGFVVRHLAEEPIQVKETLTFDYTKNSPVAFVRLITCPCEPSDAACREKREVGNLGGPLVIPPRRKLEATISLTLPESDYNSKLGIFQVRVDFLSASGKVLASSIRPCMLQFKSQPINLLMTFLKFGPLITGYSSETQSLNLKFGGFTEGDIPFSCVRVRIEQRAEFYPGGGVPQIYDASLTLESQLPFPKGIIWRWKKTVFIWIGTIIFSMEFLFVLLCCMPITLFRGRAGGPNSRPAQR